MTHSHPNSVTTPTTTSNPPPSTYDDITTPDQPLTPTLFQQIQSLFLLQNSPIQLLYSQFKLSLTVLFSILHDHTTQSLRRAIDEHTYLCAQRAHLELILETENVAIALAKTENPTQEQRRRLGTLNATLKTSFKNLQALRDSLLSDDHTTDHTELGDPHTTPKPTHTKRTTPRRTLTRAHTAPTPTTPTSTPPHTHPNTTPKPQSTYSNTPNTNPHTHTTATNTTANTTHTTPTQTHTAPAPTQPATSPTNTTPTSAHTPAHTTPTHNQLTNHPIWTAIHPHLSPEARQIAHSLAPESLAYLLTTHQNSAAEILEAQAARNRAALQQLTTQRTTTHRPQPALI